MERDYRTDWALLENGLRVHISDVTSFGRKGYFCPGEKCGKPLQAVSRKDPMKRNYFRHDHNFLDKDFQCEYADETYRHKVAKEILIALCQIKLPQIKKFPPIGIGGEPNILQDFMILKASKALPELTFYLDELGELHWTKAVNPDKAEVIVRPDVTFFNDTEKPILFIELVATNDIDPEKSAKLRRIGVDTVRVKVPRHNEEEIRRTFFVTEYTFWEYSRLESETEYTKSLSRRDYEGISQFDLEQKELFRESARCRAARIRSLICEIRMYLESESNTPIARELQVEIDSITRHEAELTKQLLKIQRSIRERVQKEYKDQKERIETTLEEERDEFKSLEQGYKEDGCRLENERERTRRSINKEEGVVRQIESKWWHEEQARTQLRDHGKRLREDTEQNIIRLSELREIIDRLKAEESILLNKENQIRKEEKRIREEEERIAEGGNGIKQEYFDYGYKLIQGRNFEPDFPLPRSYKGLLRARQYIGDIRTCEQEEERLKKAKEYFESGAYKSWS